MSKPIPKSLLQALQNTKMTLFIAISWQLLMTAFGFLIEFTFSDRNAHSVTLFSHMFAWDGGWYRMVTQGWYAGNLPSAAFYPLFPFCVLLVHGLSFGLLSYGACGIIVNTLCLWATLTVLLKLSKIFFGKTSDSWLLAALFLSSPAALFLHVYYTEALFCALGFWAYYYAIQRQWARVGILLGLITATRFPGLLFIVLCAAEFVRAHNWKLSKVITKDILWFLLAPLGFISYAIYLKIRIGDWLGMFHAYHETSDWSYHMFNPDIIKPIYHGVGHTAKIFVGAAPFAPHNVIDPILPAIAIVLLIASSIYCIWRRGLYLPLGIFGFASIVLFTLNSNIVSVHRYVLPCIPIYLSAVALIHKHPRWRPILYVAIVGCFMLQVYLYILFTMPQPIG